MFWIVVVVDDVVIVVTVVVAGGGGNAAACTTQTQKGPTCETEVCNHTSVSYFQLSTKKTRISYQQQTPPSVFSNEMSTFHL